MKQPDLITQVKETIEHVSPSERARLISELEQLLQEPEREDTPGHCPRCEYAGIVKKGRTKTGQRYLCKGCGRTFGHTTNKVLGTSKLSLETWKKYLECFIDCLTVRRSAKRCGVSIQTAFFMRHRVLELVEKHAKKVTVHKCTTAFIDETFFPVNIKGTTPPKGIRAKRRGGDKRRKDKSQSKSQVCVVMGVTSTGAIFHQVAGYSSLSADDARLVLGDIVQPGATVVTDKGAGYVTPLKELGSTHHAYDSRKGRKELAPINSLHSKTKRFMRKFSNVASKNLDRYLCWQEWLENNTERETMEVVRDSHYSVHRSSMRGHDIPPMDGLTRRTITGID